MSNGIKIRYLVQAGPGLKYTLYEEVTDLDDGSEKTKELLTSYNHDGLNDIAKLLTEAFTTGVIVGKLVSLADEVARKRQEVQLDREFLAVLQNSGK